MTDVRPALTDDLSGSELLRWYWLRSELAAFARSVGVSTAGGKQELTARLVAYLDRGASSFGSTADAGRTAPVERRRPAAAAALAEPLTSGTVLPAGQRCSQQLRRYFTEVIGPAFRFDEAMRAFIATSGGRTLGDAVKHWYATRSTPDREIGAQFELNRFMREWHRDHPGEPRSAGLDAWAVHRSLPVEARGQAT